MKIHILLLDEMSAFADITILQAIVEIRLILYLTVAHKQNKNQNE